MNCFIRKKVLKMASTIKGCLLLHICLLIGKYVSSVEDRTYRIGEYTFFYVQKKRKLGCHQTHRKPSLHYRQVYEKARTLDINSVGFSQDTKYMFLSLIVHHTCTLNIFVKLVLKQFQVLQQDTFKLFLFVFISKLSPNSFIFLVKNSSTVESIWNHNTLQVGHG